LYTSLYDQNVRTVVTFKPMNAMIKPTLRARPEPFAPRRHTMPRAASPSLPTPDPTDGRRTAVPVPATETKTTHLADDAATRAMMASAMRSVAVAAARHRRRVVREERDDDDDGTDDVRTKRVDADAERWRTNRDGRDDDDDDDGGGVRGGGGYVSGVVFGEEANRERGLGRGAGDGGSGVEEE